MSIKHSTQTSKPNRSDYDVSATAWNAAHTIEDDAIEGTHIKDGDISNTHISASAAIAQTKLNLAITNSEVSASAAIAYSKLDLAGAIGAAYHQRVCKEGATTYIVRDKSGMEVSGDSSTYPEIAIDNAKKNLTDSRDWYEKLLLLGDFADLDDGAGYTDGCVKIDDWTVLELTGKIALADSVNKSMIVNSNIDAGAGSRFNRNIEIYGGVWDGNESGNTAGSPILWKHSDNMTGDPWVNLRIHDMQIDNFEDNAVHIEATSGVTFEVAWIYNLKLRNGAAGANGIYLERISSAELWGMLPLDSGASDRGLYVTSGGTLNVHDSFINKGAYIDTQRFRSDNIHFDVGDSPGHGVRLSVTRGLLSNWFVKQTGSGPVLTNAAVHLETLGGSACQYVQMTNLQAGRLGGSVTSKWDYAWEEPSGQGPSFLTNIITDNMATAAVQITHADSWAVGVHGGVAIA